VGILHLLAANEDTI